MKRIIIICGSISGLISISWFLYAMQFTTTEFHFENGMIYGYITMLLAFSLVFVGIKNFRDKYNGGEVSFGKAFKIGFYISLLASTIYVITWMIDYHFFIPDFLDKYMDYEMTKMKAAGATAQEIKTYIDENAKLKELYKNPLFVALMTYMEILPLGLVISLISAGILKKKAKAV